LHAPVLERLIFPEVGLAPPFAPGKIIKQLHYGMKKGRDNAGLMDGSGRSVTT